MVVKVVCATRASVPGNLAVATGPVVEASLFTQGLIEEHTSVTAAAAAAARGVAGVQNARLETEDAVMIAPTHWKVHII